MKYKELKNRLKLAEDIIRSVKHENFNLMEHCYNAQHHYSDDSLRDILTMNGKTFQINSVIPCIDDYNCMWQAQEDAKRELAEKIVELLSNMTSTEVVALSGIRLARFQPMDVREYTKIRMSIRCTKNPAQYLSSCANTTNTIEGADGRETK